MNKVLENVNCNLEIVDYQEIEGLTISKENKEEKITIFDKNLINKIINQKINKKYQELLNIIIDINDSEDATTTDGELVLIKIDSLKEKILKEYGKYLTKEALNKYLQMFESLGNKLEIPRNRRGFLKLLNYIA